MLRTIEDILGTDHLNIHTATQRPMAAVFDLGEAQWNFKAIPSAFLGLKGSIPYPSQRTGTDLRNHRKQILRAAGLVKRTYQAVLIK